MDDAPRSMAPPVRRGRNRAFSSVVPPRPAHLVSSPPVPRALSPSPNRSHDGRRLHRSPAVHVAEESDKMPASQSFIDDCSSIDIEEKDCGDTTRTPRAGSLPTVPVAHRRAMSAPRPRRSGPSEREGMSSKPRSTSSLVNMSLDTSLSYGTIAEDPLDEALAALSAFLDGEGCDPNSACTSLSSRSSKSDRSLEGSSPTPTLRCASVN